MNLEQLRGFAEIAEIGHFTRAAERLHLAQPSLSRQISSLESEFGLELFHRVRGGVRLTTAGERLLPYARRMLADADAARDEMASLAGLKRGRIRLGATPTLCTSLVVEVLAEFRERYPEIEIEILERGSRSLITALVEGSLDLALIVTSVSSGAARAVLELESVLSERLVAVSAADRPDPFAGPGSAGRGPGSRHRGPVTLEQLSGVPIVQFPESYDLRSALDSAFRTEGVQPLIAVEGAEMDAALRFAERGVGVAVVPAMVAADRPDLRAAPLASEALARTISVARRADMAPSPASAAMQALIRDIADRLAAQSGSLGRYVTRMPSGG
ncbi:LysR family transcriptional regulator [Leucobacter sp. CSA2]|uniref:LysR family transcriptional regulator n=1 Tax=Leucobacter edaphi TaxID=2796472 RepID=A0A934QER9_9MICO|nr:LysR substrate-binding domain-containing protein [Leucobacter edaphi]MBK0422605.1 LysR family transcriptional regulator [Leucobacter edaphi]